jgi:sugar/nucleoside kinase (ribokinase family)
MPYEIIACGQMCLDLLPRMGNVTSDNLATTGKLFETGAMQISTGGSVANTGLALQRLGIKTGLMGLVGDDFIGRATIEFLRNREHQLGDHIHVEPNMSSSYTIVLAPDNQDRSFLHYFGTNNSFDYDKVDFDMIAQGDMFHLGYPTVLPKLFAHDGAGLAKIFKKVHDDLGLITSMDLSLPDPTQPSGQASWKTIFERTLPYVDIFIPSIEEIMLMLRRSDYEAWGSDLLSHLTANYLKELAQELLELGSAIVGFKLGESGLYLHTSSDENRLSFLDNINQPIAEWLDKTFWQPAFKVDVVGTTGAGDSAYAGFLSALYRGLDCHTCVKWACAVGACNVESFDSTSGVLGWEETAKRLSTDWKTLKPVSQ